MFYIFIRYINIRNLTYIAREMGSLNYSLTYHELNVLIHANTFFHK